MGKFQFFTARHPMRLIALLIMISLVSATILYFDDILVGGFAKLIWNGKPLVSTFYAQWASAIMSITIGLGVLAESATTIWEKLNFWGQIIDNKIIHFFYRKTFFLDEAFHLLHKTRLLFNRTNFSLQAIAIPTDNSVCNEADLRKLSNKIKNIKNNCQKINTLLENNRAKDTIHLKKQEHLKQILNNLVSANLEMSSWVESLASQMANTTHHNGIQFTPRHNALLSPDKDKSNSIKSNPIIDATLV